MFDSRKVVFCDFTRPCASFSLFFFLRSEHFVLQDYCGGVVEHNDIVNDETR